MIKNTPDQIRVGKEGARRGGGGARECRGLGKEVTVREGARGAADRRGGGEGVTVGRTGPQQEGRGDRVG